MRLRRWPQTRLARVISMLFCYRYCVVWKVNYQGTHYRHCGGTSYSSITSQTIEKQEKGYTTVNNCHWLPELVCRKHHFSCHLPKSFFFFFLQKTYCWMEIKCAWAFLTCTYGSPLVGIEKWWWRPGQTNHQLHINILSIPWQQIWLAKLNSVPPHNSNLVLLNLPKDDVFYCKHRSSYWVPSHVIGGRCAPLPGRVPWRP